MKVDIDAMNALVKGLPQAVLTLMPDDAGLIFLVGLIPSPITPENAKHAMIVMSLICRKVGQTFNDLAAEEEKLVREWES